MCGFHLITSHALNTSTDHEIAYFCIHQIYHYFIYCHILTIYDLGVLFRFVRDLGTPLCLMDRCCIEVSVILATPIDSFITLVSRVK